MGSVQQGGWVEDMSTKKSTKEYGNLNENFKILETLPTIMGLKPWFSLALKPKMIQTPGFYLVGDDKCDRTPQTW